MKNQQPEFLGKFARAVLIAGAGISLLAGTNARAQEATASASATDEKVVKMDRFIVTGSNIPTTETSGEARTFPVQTIDRRAIEQSGIFNTVELLQKMALSNGGSVPFTNNATGFTPGAASTSLRGLGPDATLVLVNGRRMAPYPVGTGGTTAFVDLNSIPLAAIERVEVLKDGASATYGADAVAGVINIIMRRDYKGAVADVTYGNTTNKDSSEFTASFVYGISDDKGSITIGANYQSRQAIFNRDRDYSAVPPFLSTNSSPGNFQVTRAAALQALGLPANAPLTIDGVADTTTATFFATTGPSDPNTGAPLSGNQNQNNHGSLPPTAYTFTTGRSSVFNFNEFAGSFPEITRKGLSIAWDREFFSPNVKLYGDAFYQNTYQVDELAPYATGNFLTPGQTTIVIPAATSNPVLTPDEAASGGRTAAAGAFNPFNPFNQDISGSSRLRLAEFGNRIFQTTNNAFAFTAGIAVNDIGGKWNLDAKGRYSTIQNHVNNRLVSTSRFLRVLNAADPIFNPNSPSYIGTTVPYNPFGYYKNDIPSNAATVNYALHYQRDENTSTVADGGIVLNTSELMELPAGGAGFAIGADYRRESIEQLPDSTLQSGDILGAPPSSPIERQRKIASYFAEIEVPIFGEKHSVTGAHALSLNVAARYEDFLTSSRHAFVPKIGVRWMPIDDTLVFRASWGKSFREPSLYELYSGKTAGLVPITDPVTGNFEPEQNVTVTGNKNLEAEDGKSYNFGVIWSPKGAMEGATFSVDAWQIERIGQVLANYQDAANRSATGDLVPGESVVRDSAGNLIQVNTIFRNVGTIDVNGLDLAASYVWKTENWGRFDVGAAATWLNKFDYQTAPTLPSANIVGQADPRATPGDDGILRWKGQGWLGWNWRSLSAHITATYTDGFQDFDPDGNAFMVKSTVFWDLQVSYLLFSSRSGHSAKWYSDLKVTAGANNIFDKDPPFASGGGGNSNGYPGFLYTDVGRFVYVGLEKKL